MSTKAIREALDYLRNNPTADEAPAVARQALKEVEAIERAAQVLTDAYHNGVPAVSIANVRGARAILGSIAKDAP